MSKKDYIDAVNEIEVDEKLKQETINNISQKSTVKKYNKFYPLASLAVMCAIIIALILPNTTIAPINNVQGEDIIEDENLPKVKNFNNLYSILRNNSENQQMSISRGEILEDAIATTEKSAATNEIIENDYSKTNVQVEGVDEADIVKTDGKYIYYLTNNRLTITDVSDDNNIISASNIEFSESRFDAQQMFLRENKLVIIGTAYKENKQEQVYDNRTDDMIVNYYPDNQYTFAKIYNIDNRENPVLDRTVELEGYYLSSRMIGDNIYLISNKYINSYLCKKYEQQELNENDFKIKYTDSVEGEDEKCVEFDSIYYIPESQEDNYLNIATFNISKQETVNINSYLGAGSQIYASNENLYITKVKYDYESYLENYDINTEIYKFKLEEAKCTFIKSGKVPGSILNQFSMDETNGYFRIATTDSKSWIWRSEENTNNLYVLNENLEIVGKVEGLAPGERIYSVRFMGDRAYMVTFVQTDPLFVIDLSEPTNPTVLGELKIPGYSKYLHPYDETHLIGFGENTKVVNYGYGDQVITDGMKMALFDVTDPNNPTEMYSVNIGEKGTYSELLYNHKALLFSKEKNIIAFPISITEDDYEVKFQGAIVYGLSLSEGFELKGKITNIADKYEQYYYNNNVERIIYIKDTLYTLSNNLIKATDMNTMTQKSSVNIK